MANSQLQYIPSSYVTPSYLKKYDSGVSPQGAGIMGYPSDVKGNNNLSYATAAFALWGQSPDQVAPYDQRNEEREDGSVIGRIASSISGDLIGGIVDRAEKALWIVAAVAVALILLSLGTWSLVK